MENNINLGKRIVNRIIYHGWISFYCRSKKSCVNINKENSIAIFSHPRGGSTWLAQLLCNIPDTGLALEPLFKNKLVELKKLNFDWYQYIPINTEWNDTEFFFKKLFNREILPLSVYYNNDLLRLPFKKRIIFKFCYGNLLMPWLTKRFNLSSFWLLRHPCGVINSQLNHNGWKEFRENKITSFYIPTTPFNEYYSLYRDILEKVDNSIEHLAATWALNVKYPSSFLYFDHNWLTISYESLLLNSFNEIERIFKYLNLPIPPTIYDKLLQPSFTSDKKKIYRESQLANWRKDLSKKNQKSIMSIIRDFDIDFYTLNEDEPNYDFIYS